VLILLIVDVLILLIAAARLL